MGFLVLFRLDGLSLTPLLMREDRLIVREPVK